MKELQEIKESIKMFGSAAGIAVAITSLFLAIRQMFKTGEKVERILVYVILFTFGVIIAVECAR